MSSDNNEVGITVCSLTGDPKIDIRLLANELSHMKLKQQGDEAKVKNLQNEVHELKKKLFAGKWTIVGIVLAIGGGSITFWEKLVAIIK